MGMIGFPSIKLTYTSLTDFKRRKAAIKEPETVEWLRQALAAEGPFTLLDIGANIGGYSLIACALHEHCSAVAVEPFPPTFNTLCQNIAKNGWHRRILPINGFFGSHDASPTFEMAVDKWTSGLAEHSASGAYALRLPVYDFPDIERFVPAAGPILCKVDVDGGEMSVLAGLTELLRSTRLRSMLIECEQEQQEPISLLLRQSGLTRQSRFGKVNQRQINLIAARETPLEGVATRA